MRKVKKVKVNMLVAVPDRTIYHGRRDPYEYENGIVTEISEDGTQAKVKVKRYMSETTSYEKWFYVEFIKHVSYYHRVGEESEFMKWIESLNKAV